VWWGLAGGLACAAVGLSLGFEWKIGRLLRPQAVVARGELAQDCGL